MSIKLTCIIFILTPLRRYSSHYPLLPPRRCYGSNRLEPIIGGKFLHYQLISCIDCLSSPSCIRASFSLFNPFDLKILCTLLKCYALLQSLNPPFRSRFHHSVPPQKKCIFSLRSNCTEKFDFGESIMYIQTEGWQDVSIRNMCAICNKMSWDSYHALICIIQ